MAIEVKSVTLDQLASDPSTFSEFKFVSGPNGRTSRNECAILSMWQYIPVPEKVRLLRSKLIYTKVRLAIQKVDDTPEVQAVCAEMSTGTPSTEVQVRQLVATMDKDSLAKLLAELQTK